MVTLVPIRVERRHQEVEVVPFQLEMSPASLGQVLMAGIQTEDFVDSLEERHQGIALQGLHLVEQTVDAELD
jgi:hypothetical protein